jgi:dTMP kinase
MTDRSMNPRGLFITFEGGEGVGKSTQIRRLAASLEARGHRVVVTREPGGTPLAEAIRGVLLGAEGSPDAMTQALLFAAARRDHVRVLIEPALAAGAVVLCDRFADSTRSYQGGALPAATIETLIALATGGLVPDLTLLLDLASEEGLARARLRGGAADGFERADSAFHAEVRARFLALASAEPGRIALIDASAGEAEVAAVIAACVEARLMALTS